LNGGKTPVTASVAPYEGVAFTKNGWVPVTPARALSEQEVGDIVELYR
jgi:N-ethylmaleimide reductase